MRSTFRCYALVGAVMYLLGCGDSGGLKVGGALTASGAGGAPASQAIGTGGAAAANAGGTGGAVAITFIEPEIPDPGPSCGLTCFAPDANIIAHWTFDSVEAGQVPDISGNGFGATVHGSAELVPATCGSAMSLSGNYLDVESWNKLEGFSRVTYDVLFRIHGMRNDGTAAGDMLSELVNDSYWYPIGGAVVRVRNQVCQFAIATTSGWQHLTDVVRVSLDEWHHVYASFDQTTKTMTLQLDCNAPVQMTYPGTFVPSYVPTLRIGACVVDPPSRFVNGEIDSVVIRGW